MKRNLEDKKKKKKKGSDKPRVEKHQAKPVSVDADDGSVPEDGESEKPLENRARVQVPVFVRREEMQPEVVLDDEDLSVGAREHDRRGLGEPAGLPDNLATLGVVDLEIKHLGIDGNICEVQCKHHYYISIFKQVQF